MKSDPEMIRKAALLVSSLDDDTADKLLEQMPLEMANLVRRAWAALDSIDSAEQEAVIGEFFSQGRESTPTPAESATPEDEGVELSARLAREFGLTANAESASPSPVHPADELPFGFLQSATVARIAPCLEGENPQAIAVVTSHLSPQQALEVLAALSARTQAEVLRRIASLGETDPEILREVERGLQSRMSARSEQEQLQSARLTALRALLQHAPDELRQSMLNNLAQCEPSLAEQLGYSPPSTVPRANPVTMVVDQAPRRFQSLDELDDAVLSAVLAAADPELTALALAGASPALIDRIVRRVAPAEGQRFRRALDRLGPTRLSDIDKAQTQLLLLAEKLATDAEVRSRAVNRALAQAA